MLEFDVQKMKKGFKKSNKKTESTCSHNDEVDASASGHRHLPRQFIPYFLARRLARKYEKMSPQAPLPLQLRHLIITVRSDN